VPEENKELLMRYRLEQAHECLNAAMLLINAASFKDATNRSYYCLFHAMRALLAMEGFDSKKHSGIIAAFRQKYIKSGIFPVEFSDIINGAFEARGSSDYEDFFVISKEDVVHLFENAKEFLAAVEAYLKSLSKNSQ